jgi:NAD(P)-dependent dehydrogenase (short-subunit alcohol dehydrogenase family)
MPVVRSLLKAGVVVHAFERSRKEAEARLGDDRSQIGVHETNVFDEHSLERAFDEVEHSGGKAGILVNTVGGFLKAKPLTEVTLDEWNRMMTLNLTSAFLSCREFLRRCDTSYGRIFNVSAMVGLDPAPHKIPYAVSKAGGALLTQLLAGELKATGITVHAFAPSILLTDANKESMPDEETSTWVKPESIAELIVSLSGEDAAPFSGTTIRAYGGV